MPSFRRILFPVDFSERCRGAAHYALALAGKFGSQLTLLHVVETPIARPGELDFGALAFETDLDGRVEHCRQLLDSFLDSDTTPCAAAESLEVSKRVEQGDPARTIIRIAAEEESDLIVMPTHGYGAFRRFILGSVTAKVLHDAECPVWTGVHMEAAPPPEEIEIRRVLCAVDLSDSSLRLLRRAGEIAGELGAELTIVHAVPTGEAVLERGIDNELRSQLIIEARQRIRSRVAELGLRVEVIDIAGGEVAHVVREAAANQHADLLIIGRSAHSGIAGRLRTHSYAIIRESPCPVMSI